MDADGLFTLVLILLHWRVFLCLVVSSCAAIALVHLFPWFTGLQGAVIALLGLLPGAMWGARSTNRGVQKESADSNTTQGVAGAAAAIAGATWGAVSSSSVHSFLAGLVVLCVAAWGWSSYVGRQHLASKQRVCFCVVLAALAYPLGAVLGHNAL